MSSGESEGFTLVDTTMPRTGAALIAAATAAGGAIRRIALTHGHGDHVGSLDELSAPLGDGVAVLMGDLDARIHAGENVVDGKLTGSWPKMATYPTCVWTAATESAASRSSRAPATRRAMSRSSTPATGR